jgi:hypothetical protein
VGTPSAYGWGFPPPNIQQLTKEKKMNTFTFTDSILKNIKDYNTTIKATVVDRRLEQMPDGNYRSKFVASRQVTFFDPELQKILRENITDTDTELVVCLVGYETSTLSEKTKQWYDNKIVTELLVKG